MFQEQIILGWREWISLPNLGNFYLKAKIDTGARTSVLHAFQTQIFDEQGKTKIKFSIHPLQYSKEKVVNCIADVIDRRLVIDSSGHQELRYIIKTVLKMNEQEWPIEVSLTNRDSMRFRMLIGRTAIKKIQGTKFLIDPGASYVATKQIRDQLLRRGTIK